MAEPADWKLILLVGGGAELAQQIPIDWNLPQIILDRVGNRPGRQRAIYEEGHLLLILHGPSKPSETNREARFFWRNPKGAWKAAGIESLDAHLTDYRQRLHEIDALEDAAKTATEYFEVLEQLAPIHRSTGNLYSVLQRARELVKKDKLVIDYRDRSYELSRTAELLMSVGKNALDFHTAKKAEEQSLASHQMAVSAHRLNILAALFFPILTLTALFSTNFKVGFEDSTSVWPFAGMLLFGLLSGVFLLFFVTQKSEKKK